VVLLLTTGLRPEEARALRWDHVDLDARTIAVWRPDRAEGDSKTAKSRRTLRLAQVAVGALRQRKAVQVADRLQAGEAWQDTGLVFTTTIGIMFDQHNIRRLPPDHPGRGPGRRVGSPRPAPHLWERRRCAHRGGRAPRWCSGSYRPAVGHGLAHLLGQGLGELRVGLSSEGVVNGGERQP
jgi:integrase